MKAMLLLSLGLFLSVLVLPSAGVAENFQKTPITLRASKILPKALLSGSNFKVKETVKSDLIR